MDIFSNQNKLKINVIDYDLDKMWRSHPLIEQLRAKVDGFLPRGTYDRQDLEHQVLFRLTTFDPGEITDEIIQHIIEEQYLIVKNRLDNLKFDIEYLFRGLTGKYQDLNVNDRLELVREKDKVIAKNKCRSFNIDFRQVQNEDIVSLFTNELHYIHRDRPKGETFGFYFSGEEIPWAIETTEPSVISKQYKRDALLANGIDPNKAIELTRFYTLPGAPTNAISLMDGLVAKYYKAKDIEALFTTTMPMYSKTKSSTIAGGINKPLLVKDLRHKFIPETIKGIKCYRHVTTIPEDKNEIETIITHPNFPVMLVVEVFRTINEPSGKPIKILEKGDKVIYVKQRNKKIEKEVKFQIKDIAFAIKSIRKISKFSRVEYIRDIIFGSKEEKRKIRLRITDNFENCSVEAIYKYRIECDNGVKNEVEEIIYKGENLEDALRSISSRGDFQEENSYEKTRTVFTAESVEITLDIYPYGVWVEIEGNNLEDIWKIGEKIGYKKNDAITLGADELYLEWNKEKKLKEAWDVRFGLTGEK
jgi:adenylate cyclase class IV